MEEKESSTSPISPPRCFKCGGFWSEPTGHVFRPDVVYCGPCARAFFFGYYRPRMKQMNYRKGKQLENFNLAASTSIGADHGSDLLLLQEQ